MSSAATRRPLPAKHRRWIILNAVVIAAFVNAALSALIAWGSAASEDELPLWAVPFVEGPSTAVDTIGTFFVLPFLTTLIITTTVRAELRHEKLLPLGEAPWWVERLPKTRVRRGAVIGLVCMAVLGPPAAVILSVIDFDGVSVGDFVLYKAIVGVVLGVVVTPPIALAAMRDGWQPDPNPAE